MEKLLQILAFILLLSLTMYSQERDSRYGLNESIVAQNLQGQLQLIPDDLLRIKANSLETSKFKSQRNDGFMLIQEYDILWDFGQEIWKHNRKRTYIYDQNSNRIEAIRQWTESGEPIQKKSYYYDANNYLVEEKVYDYGESEWNLSKKALYYYDGNNNLVQKTWQNWDGSQFENGSKTVYTYDENNNRSYFIEQIWEDAAWINSFKWIDYFDTNNLRYQIITKYWYESAWVNGSKGLYTYENNNLIKILGYNWDSDNSNWGEHVQRNTYVYDQDNNRTIFWLESWSEYEEEWYYNWKTYYYYLPTESEEFEHLRINLDKSIEDFQTTEDELVVEPLSRENQELSLTGVEILIDSVLHSSDGDLEFTLTHDGISETIIYYAGGNEDNFIGTKLSDRGIDSISNGIAPFIGFYKPENPLSSFVGTDPSGTWTLSIYDGVAGNTGTLQSWGLNLIYSSSSSIADELHTDFSFELYPNPAVSTITIRSQVASRKLQVFRIYDLSGRELMSGQVAEEEIDVSNLAQGLYLIRLQAGKRVGVRKLIIQ